MIESMINPFSKGDWIQWSTPHQVKRGQVITSLGCSIVVEWLGGDEQVFPNVECYLGAMANDHSRMEIIERPREASRIERETRRGVMSVTRAAATLGVTPKRVRAMLRSGQLQGTQKEGKWQTVKL